MQPASPPSAPLAQVGRLIPSVASCSLTLELVGIGTRSMLQSITAVDTLAIQRSLTILEDRYRELREIGEKRFEAWEKERGELKEQLSAQAATLQQTLVARDEQAARAKSLEDELAALTAERDAAAKEQAAAQQSATELKEQLSAQAATLQQTQTARDEQAARAKSLEDEIASLKAQQSGVAAGLQRLRHLAHPAGKAT